MKVNFYFAGAAAVALGYLPSVAQSASTAVVQQTGDDTYAQILQQGPGNATEIVQDGVDLNARVTVQGRGNGANEFANLIEQFGEGSTARVNVVGDYNSFSISQSGKNGPANNVADINIIGSGNSAQISQLNDLGPIYGNSAYIDQAGGFNTAVIAQTVTEEGGVYGNSNDAAIIQRGYENSARIEQRGIGNEARIEQDGNNNTFSLTQLGSGSSFALKQEGNGQSFSDTQRMGYDAYTITQTGCLVSSCPTIQIHQGATGAPVSAN